MGMPRQSKSRNAWKLRRALEALGHTRVVVWWEPIGPALEMCGHSGGYFFRSAQKYGPIPFGITFREASEAVHVWALEPCALPSGGESKERGR